MATFNSLQYAKLYVEPKGVLARSSDFGGRPMPLPFDFTWLAGAAAGDIVRMCKIPGNHIVVGMDLIRQAMGSTAVIVGTTDDTDRFSLSQSWAAAGAISFVELTGMLYSPAADMDVLATFVTGAPTVGSRFAGCMWVLMAP